MIPQPVFDIPDFKRLTTEKLTKYYVQSQGAMEALKRYNPETLPPYTMQLRHKNLQNLTTVPEGPYTVETVNEFYRKCDVICDALSPQTQLQELLRILFAATCGIQFIRSTLLGSNEHPANVEILNEASDRSLEAFCTPEEIAAGRIPAQTRIVRPNPGDCLRDVDRNNGRECHIRIKDHGTSAMRGEYFIVTPILEGEDDGRDDREVSLEEIEEMLENRF